jgi:hypothetical protein
MTDAARAESGPVFRLIYRSHNLIPAAERKSQLGEIFSAARSNNKRAEVTGALLCTDEQFAQTLEGPEPVVRALYTRICQDSRHGQVELLETRTVTERVFGRWAMARVSADGEPDIPLLTNVDKGGISPAQPRATTAAQEVVLGYMRESLGGSREPAPSGQ